MKKDEGSETGLGTRPIRKRNPDESKRRILDAAERAFASRGFEGARLRDIAQEAGVHHALVHHYYGDKRGLFKEVVQRALGTVSSSGLASMEGTTSLEGGITHLVSVLFDFFSTHCDLLRIIEGAFRDKDSMAHQLTAAALGELAVPFLTQIRQSVIDGQKHGLIRGDLTPDSMLLFGFSAIVHPFVTGQGVITSLGITSGTGEDLEQRKHELIRYIIGAMRPIS